MGKVVMSSSTVPSVRMRRFPIFFTKTSTSIFNQSKHSVLQVRTLISNSLTYLIISIFLGEWVNPAVCDANGVHRRMELHHICKVSVVGGGVWNPAFCGIPAPVAYDCPTQMVYVITLRPSESRTETELKLILPDYYTHSGALLLPG